MSIIKQILAAGCVTMGLLAGVAQAAEVSLDGSSRQAMQQSAKQMTMTLPQDKKYQFAAAVNVISLKEAKRYFEEAGREPKDLREIGEQDMNALMGRVMALLDGMTAQDIIDLASGQAYAAERQALGEFQKKLQRQQQVQ